MKSDIMHAPLVKSARNVAYRDVNIYVHKYINDRVIIKIVCMVRYREYIQYGN